MSGGKERKEGCRVYVGNLDWKTSWQDLKDHMRTAGEVVYADVFLDHIGRSKGCGIVEYSSPDAAQTAISTLNDTKIGNSSRLIFVREDREQKPDFVRGRRNNNSDDHNSGNNNERVVNNNNNVGNNNSNQQGRKIFINGIPFATKSDELREHFAVCGTIEKCNILMNLGRSKGQGYVLYETTEAAQKAIQDFNNTEFQGRTIIVKEDRYA